MIFFIYPVPTIKVRQMTLFYTTVILIKKYMSFLDFVDKDIRLK